MRRPRDAESVCSYTRGGGRARHLPQRRRLARLAGEGGAPCCGGGARSLRHALPTRAPRAVESVAARHRSRRRRLQQRAQHAPAHTPLVRQRAAAMAAGPILPSHPPAATLRASLAAAARRASKAGSPQREIVLFTARGVNRRCSHHQNGSAQRDFVPRLRRNAAAAAAIAAAAAASAAAAAAATPRPPLLRGGRRDASEAAREVAASAWPLALSARQLAGAAREGDLFTAAGCEEALFTPRACKVRQRETESRYRGRACSQLEV